MKKTKKIIKLIFINYIIIELMFSLVSTQNIIKTSSMAYAASETTFSSVQALQQTLVGWAERFLAINGGNCVYPPDGSIFTERETTYYNGTFTDGTYHFDCVGWVDYAVHYALGLNSTCGKGPADGIFVTPQSGIKENTYLTEISISAIEPGDLLIDTDSDYPHVSIYIGGNQNIGMYSNEYGGLGRHTNNSNSSEKYNRAARFTDAAVAAASGSTEIPITTPIHPGGQEELDYNVDLDNINFKYAGNPKGVAYNGETTLPMKIYSLFSQFINFAMNLISYFCRATFVGWANIIESGVSYILYKFTI